MCVRERERERETGRGRGRDGDQAEIDRFREGFGRGRWREIITLTADRAKTPAFRRAASSGSGLSFGRLAAKDKRRSHSSASCRRCSGDGRTTGFRLYEKTGGTAIGLNLGFW